MRVVVPGGTGFVGAALVRHLLARPHEVVVASRDPSSAVLPAGAGACALEPASLRDALRGAGAVVNLAGASVMDSRWTEARRRELRRSRVDLTADLVQRIAEVPDGSRPRVLVNASAIGWYGETGEREATESAPPA